MGRNPNDFYIIKPKANVCMSVSIIIIFVRKQTHA